MDFFLFFLLFSKKSIVMIPQFYSLVKSIWNFLVSQPTKTIIIVDRKGVLWILLMKSKKLLTILII